MAPKKKEKNLKRRNIITLKLTDIELAVLNEAAKKRCSRKTIIYG